MNQIITSILDSDLYKFTMQQYVFHQYPNVKVRYKFVCRNKDVKLGFLAAKVQEQVNSMKALALTLEASRFLSTMNFLRSDYIDFLRGYRFNPDEVIIEGDEGADLKIEIGGDWKNTILWEVPLLAIVNQLYFEATTDFEKIQSEGKTRLDTKIRQILEFPRFTFTDFGTRRRYSADWQKYILQTFKTYCSQNLVGTSNVQLAMDLGLKAIGTMAHEIFSAGLALVDRYEESQKRTLYTWLQEYNTDLGHALTDTFTTDAFFRDFKYILANSYQGVRHDSGDAIEFGHKVIEHYKKLSIDPRMKSIVFSDGLTIPKALEIYKEFTGLIGLGFGIGTSLTNDLGVDALNIVIKLVECNDQPVCKLSDNITKAIGDEKVIEEVRKAYKI